MNNEELQFELMKIKSGVEYLQDRLDMVKEEIRKEHEDEAIRSGKPVIADSGLHGPAGA